MASKEIIVSRGAIESPKLLMISGIGLKEDLENLGIKSKVDLPVGKFMKDHIGIHLAPFMVNKKISVLPEEDFGLDTILDYFLRGSGHFTVPSLLFAHGFINSENGTGEWPDIQLGFTYAGIYKTIGEDLSKLTGAKLEDYKSYLAPYLGQNGISVGLILGRPESAGNLKLKSNDYRDEPLIDPRYFEEKNDLRRLVKGIKFVVDLVENSGPFKEIEAKMPRDLRWPGCKDVGDLMSDEYWECYVKHLGFTIYHAVGTCRMGKGVEDPRAVVDSKLRVLKTKGLRVVDASVMPEIINGNTNAATIMIGEKAADMIREHWSEQYLVCDKFTSIFLTKKSENGLLSYCQCFYTQFL